MIDIRLKGRTRFWSGAWLVLCSVLWAIGGCQVATQQDAPMQSEDTIPSEDAIAASRAPASLSDPEQLVSPDLGTSDELLSSDSPRASQDTQALSGNIPAALVPATTETERVPQVQQGRNNPFDPLPTTPYIVRRPSQGAQVFPPNTLVPAPTSSAIPRMPIAGSPQNIVPVPLAVPPAPTSAVPVPSVQAGANSSVATIPPAQGNRAETSVSELNVAPPVIEFSGVVQLGDRVSLIVKEPGASSSRYVSVGDAIANGQFIVKAVDFNRGPTPAVILEQAGIESVHWVGSSISAASGI